MLLTGALKKIMVWKQLEVETVNLQTSYNSRQIRTSAGRNILGRLLLDAVIVLPVWSIWAGIVLPTDQSDCSMPLSHVIKRSIEIIISFNEGA